MLESEGVRYKYREYREDPLSVSEIQAVLKKLRLSPRDVLRRKDRAYKAAGLSGTESDADIIRAMADHPTLLQRPIGIAGRRAVLGRPIETLLELT